MKASLLHGWYDTPDSTSQAGDDEHAPDQAEVSGGGLVCLDPLIS